MTAPKVSMLSVEESIRRIRNLGYDEAFGELSVFRILLQNEKVAGALANTLTTLLFTGNSLDPRLRELIIMRLGWATNSVYEWTQHWRIARDMGIS